MDPKKELEYHRGIPVVCKKCPIVEIRDTRGQQFPPKLPALDLERREVSRRTAVFPRGSFLLFLCPCGTEALDTLFQRQFHLPITKEPFVFRCTIALSPVQTLFAPRTSQSYVGGCDDVAIWVYNMRDERSTREEEHPVTRIIPGNNFACFDGVVSGKEAYATSAKNNARVCSCRVAWICFFLCVYPAGRGYFF